MEPVYFIECVIVYLKTPLPGFQAPSHILLSEILMTLISLCTWFAPCFREFLRLNCQWYHLGFFKYKEFSEIMFCWKKYLSHQYIHTLTCTRVYPIQKSFTKHIRSQKEIIKCKPLEMMTQSCV